MNRARVETVVLRWLRRLVIAGLVVVTAGPLLYLVLLSVRPLSVVVIYLAHAVPVALYMLRNYFEAVPASLEEAARVDGPAGSAGAEKG